MSTTIEIDGLITVGELADKLVIPVSKLITELIKNGLMVTVNEKIDVDTAQIITSELGLDVVLVKKEAEVSELFKREKQSHDPNAVSRPPVVAVMGHVDHGKTSLLDAIRNANTVKKEAGGITQHISAYQVEHNNRSVTFLDTPGHEAFAAIREHGAHLTDLVVIVVAADDGIKPQTLEAIRFAKKAGVKMIVAANKIDKSEADINRLKQQLAEQNLLVEEWGGDLVVVPVSAKSGEGVNALLDMILLVTDLEELKAIDKGPANGLIIESHMEQGMGPVAVALVEKGRLKKGDFIVAGSSYAKARTIESTDGKSIADAGPSTPVIVSGFKSLPEFGDSFKVVSSEKEARNMTYEIAAQAHHDSKTVMSGNEFLRRISQKNEISEFNIVIRADVQGSLTSVIQSMQSINTEEVGSRVVGSGVGPINDNDIHLAKTANAVVYGFHTVLPAGIRQLASREGVSVRLYDVIYELLDDVKLELSKMLTPDVKEDIFSGLNIKKVFRTTKKELIVGGEVTNGKLEAPGMARIYRGKELIGEAEIEVLQRGQQEAKEIIEGELCGVSLKTNQKLEVLEGDKIEFFRRELIERSL